VDIEKESVYSEIARREIRPGAAVLEKKGGEEKKE